MIPGRGAIGLGEEVGDELELAEESNQPVGFRLIGMRSGRVGVHDGLAPN